MANVTQKIPNVIGGVSRLPDFDKTPGELREALNCYPDLSYGMTKRPGSEFVGNLNNFTDTQADNTYFFPLIREGKPRYVVGVNPDGIYMWDVDDPDRQITVTMTGSASSYLALSETVNKPYRHASDDRRTVIANRTISCDENTTQWSAYEVDGEDRSFNWTPRGRRRTVNSIEDLPQGEVLQVNWGDGGESQVQSNPLRPGTHYLPTSIDKFKTIDNNEQRLQPTNASGCVLKCQIDDNGAIVFLGAYRTDADGDEYFAEYGDGVGWSDQTGDRQIYDAEVWSKGSNYPDQLQLSIDGVEGSRCTTATGLLPGYVHRVVNSAADNDDVYFQAFGNLDSDNQPAPGQEQGNRDLVAGPYVWKECPSPDSYIGLDASTLPHELVETGTDTFEFRPIDYSNRWAGDNINNPAPSFIGKKINNIFFLNNRLGFLSEDNVILSRPINYGPPGTQPNQDIIPDDNPWVQRNYYEIDFFRQSAVGMNDADPIDMKAANNDVSVFHEMIATPQGVILFGDGQQSLLYQPQGLLSPLSASINSISNYDMTEEVMPIIVGETCYFINKGANFCRVYALVNQGMQNPAVINDVTKQVSDWLPNTLTDLRASLTDEMLLTFTRNSDTIYTRRVVNENASAWTKWELPSPIVDLFVDHDEVFYLTKNNGRVTIHRSDMYVIGNDSSYVFTPRILTNEDFAGIPDDFDYSESFIGYRQLSPGFTGQIEYYLPWHDYYAQGTQNQYNKWKPIGDLDGLTDVTATAVYPIQVDTSSPDKWNVGFRFQYKDENNAVHTLPSEVDGEYIYLPYDIKFRINPTQVNATWIDGCVKTGTCSQLQYIKTDGSLHDTNHWTTEIVKIVDSESSWVITLKDCDLNETYDVTLSSTDLHDILLLNIARNNCNLDPLSYRFAKLVIDNSTITSSDFNGNTSPTVMFSDGINSFTDLTSRSQFPLKTKWYERTYNANDEVYIAPLSATIRSGSSLGCSSVPWGRADDFFCRENPGKIWHGSNYQLLYYNSSVNYDYDYSTNGGYVGGSNPDRPDLNNSAACSFTSSETIGDPDIVGKPWGTQIYIDTRGSQGRSWYAEGFYQPYTSVCSQFSKFSGYYLGGWITLRGNEPNTSGSNTVGWAYDGYNSTGIPSDFFTGLAQQTFEDDDEEREYWLNEIDSNNLNRFFVSFNPPPLNADPSNSNLDNPYTEYVEDHGQNPPDQLFIRFHYEFSNANDPYSGGAQAVYTDEDTPTCDSCPPNVLVPPEGQFKDLYIAPYLDHYTDQVTLQSIDPSDPVESLKKRLIIPPTNYPLISTAQACLLIGLLPDNTGTFTASNKAGYHVDISYDSTLGGFISPIDLTRFEGKVVIGYRYDYLIELPKLFFMGQTSDYTASLTISRIKAAFGFSADATLQVRSNNNRAHFSKYFSATKPNIYDLDGSPITQSSIHAIPVHRRTEDFYFRIASDSPFPLSVDSVTWEGNYSPRYYRRM